DRVVAHVAHVDVPGGVREHREDVVRGQARLGARREGVRLLPAALPLRLDRLRVVAALPLRRRHPHAGLFGFSLTPSTWATRSTSSRAKTSTSPPGGPSSARALRALRSSDVPG